MKKRNLNRIGYVLVGLVAGALAASGLQAQVDSTRIELRKADLSGTSGTEVIMATLEVPPGGQVPRHFHHGDEFGYVLVDGSIQPPGKDPIALKSGSTFHFAREAPHGGFTVVGDAPLKVLTVHIVDKGKPLVELVK